MTYEEMQRAEAAYLEALAVQKRVQPQRGATRGQLAYRALMFRSEEAMLREFGADIEDEKMLRAARRLARSAR